MNKLNIFCSIIILICFNEICNAQLPTAMMCYNDPSILSLGLSCNNTGDSCSLGSYCKGSPNGVCTKVINKGSACTTNQECSPYQCSNGICSNTHFSIGGQECTSNTDCWANPIPGSTQILECITNICTIGTGKQCQSPSDCKFNEKCDSSNTCVATSGINEPCANRYDCNVNLVCSYENDTATTKSCQTPWSKKLNDKCDSSTDSQRIPFFYDCDIGSGLYCGNNGKCATNTPSIECTQCSNDTACKGYSESCICNNHNIPKATLNANKVGICIEEVYITQDCKSTFGELIQCCADNHCPMNQQLLFNEGSCAYKHCNTSVCKMSNCFRATGAYNMINLAQTACSTSTLKYTLPKDFTKSCPSELSTPTPSSPNYSSSMFPSIFFAVFFVLTMLILS